MDERTMYELLEVQDCADDIGKVIEMLIGVAPAVGFDEGILGRLSYVSEIIRRNSPLNNPEEDMEESAFWRILEDKEMDNHRKARILLGIAE